MEAANIKSKYPDLDANNVFEAGKGLRLLKSKAIYGANASGKSNLAKGLTAFKRMVRESVTGDKILTQAADDFVLVDTLDRHSPVFFQIRFLSESTIFRYGFTLEQNAVASEWLFANYGTKEVKLFVRESDDVKVNSGQSMAEAKQYENSFKTRASELFQPWSLFLSATAVFGINTAKSVRDSIDEIGILSDDYRGMLHPLTVHWWSVLSNMERGIAFLKSVDIDIDEVGIREMEPDMEDMPVEIRQLINSNLQGRKVPHLTSVRSIKDQQGKESLRVEALFDNFESEGTKKLLYLVPIILDALRKGTALCMDEFDARLHPRLSQKIVDLFNSDDTNPHNAQLIFITHDIGILKAYKLRRDQIAFVEKNRQGRSTLTSLVEFKGVRNDASYDKEYMLGAYGAVPKLTGMESAIFKTLENES